MLMGKARPDPPRRLQPRAAVLVAAAGAAVLLHWLVLGGGAAGKRPAPRGVDPVTVRTLEPPAPLIEEPVPPAAPVVPTAKAAVTPRPSAAVRPPPAAASQAPRGDAIEAEVAIGTVLAVAAPASAPPSLPVYRVRLAPPARLHYEMKRGMLSGNGDLVWKPGEERYELRLEANVAGLAVLTEVSTGLVGPQGLAPLRYTDQRLRRALEAANFQRDKGKITYSGPQVEYPLPAGAQDRLSWMLQLGGVLNAEPQHAAPGGEVVFFVSGARGDADTWTFRYVGPDSVSAPGGVIRAVKFTRAPRQTYDRLVEIWLDPARQHVPVRARFSAEAQGEVFELLLRDIQAP
jgi:hypothetical protein